MSFKKNARHLTEIETAVTTPTPKTSSQRVADAVVDGTLGSATLHTYSRTGSAVDVEDLTRQMHLAGFELTKGDFRRLERLLTYQFLTLNEMFNNLAQRAEGQSNVKTLDTLMRLAFKAQSQSRGTAETLSLMKNPQPYIKQANIAHGHQQVNNGTTVPAPARARNSKFVPNELLEESQDGICMDTGAPRQTGFIDSAVEAVDKKHRAKK